MGTMTQTSISINDGSLSGSGTITGDVIIGSGASLNPGNPGEIPGKMTINGDFISSGDLFFEIGGLDYGMYDILDINRDATFDYGTIEFDFIINKKDLTIHKVWRIKRKR
jgi:fibronectin-binding autotransporter adhesin